MTTRIFVKNLPASLSNEDFRRHFSQQAPVTDAKYIARRRLGYVGYRTAADAERAVRYFHKSYLGMARLFVQLAQTVDHMRSRNAPIVHQEPCKEERPDPKLQEYLSVMQAPSSARTWEDRDETTIPAQLDQHDAEYEDLPSKRRKLHDQSPKHAEVNLEDRDATTVPAQLDQHDVEYEDLPSKRRKLHEDSPKHAEVNLELGPDAGLDANETENRSDADWLRSRTNRVLDLVDPADAPVETFRPEPQRTAIEPSPSIQTVEAKGNADGDREVYKDRLFARNLPYSATEEHLREHFRAFGVDDVEIHLPVNAAGQNKGFAHIGFKDESACAAALEALDQQAFQGRLLHLLPSQSRPTKDEVDVSHLPLKKQQQIKKRSEAASSAFHWNSLFMNPDAVLSSISERLKVSKAELLDPTSSNAAVTQAHAETQVILETKAYFLHHGVNLDAFRGKTRSNVSILVKNFPYGTTAEELRSLFGAHGSVKHLLMPPSGTIAIIEFEQADEAKTAFAALAYRKIKDSILFLEKGPASLFLKEPVTAAEVPASDVLEAEEESIETTTLFVRNLNFSTSTARLEETFKPLTGFRSARVKTRTDPKKPGQILSMGFGFVEFSDSASAKAAMLAMNGYKLDQHELLVRESQRALDGRDKGKTQLKQSKGTKIIIKNLPFEATKKDVRALFSAYGQLRSVRVPQKVGSATRGFAFADFITAREAANAMNALRYTHLLGRRLVLDFAASEAADPEAEIARMQEKVSRQSDKMAIQQLVAGSARKKFALEAAEDLD